jgi:hypothetical protein
MPCAAAELRCWTFLLLLLQVLGSAADALGVAYNNVRPEVQSAALPVKVRWDCLLLCQLMCCCYCCCTARQGALAFVASKGFTYSCA